MRFKLPVAVIAALLVAAPALALAKPLTVCTESSPDGFDVVQFNSLVTTNASADVIFNSLVSYDEAAKKVVPALAQSWDVSPDGLTYTFHLRPNVQFQTTDYFKPTRALNADDVVFTFEPHARRQQSVAQGDGRERLPACAIDGSAEADQVGLEGRRQHRQVRTERSRTRPSCSILTMGFASIYSAEYADQLLKAGKQVDLNAKPIGTGPFVLKSYTKDAVIRYDVNPSYWGPKPKIDRLIYAITPDATVRAQKVKAGECQIALSPKPQDVADAKSRQVAHRSADARVHDRVRRAEHAEEAARQPEGARRAEHGVRSHDVSEDRVRQHGDAGGESVSAEHVEL